MEGAKVDGLLSRGRKGKWTIGIGESEKARMAEELM